MDIRQKFDDAIEKLYETNHYLAAEITRLGYPKLVDGYPPTAGVIWEPEKKKVCFLFNEEFVSKLSDEEFLFVLGHEVLHLVNMHVFRFRDEVDHMKSMHKSDVEIAMTMRKFNVAADCVVNDSLTLLYDFPRLEKLINDSVSILYGKDIVKVDCHDMTMKDVYYLLPESDKNVENHEGWKSFFNKDGSLKEDFVDAVRNFIENNMENSGLSDEEISKIDKMKARMEESSDSYVMKAGQNAIGKTRVVDGSSKESINWNRILFQLVESKKVEDVWNKPNKKLIQVYPEIILPSWGNQEKKEIFVAIDASGSISQRALSIFINILKNTPRNFKIETMSFDTKCYKYDMKKDKNPKGGGGTDFAIIEEYIIDKFKKYPKVVFVLTDGCGTLVNPKYPQRWCWLLYGSSSTIYCKNMKHYNLQDLLK